MAKRTQTGKRPGKRVSVGLPGLTKKAKPQHRAQQPMQQRMAAAARTAVEKGRRAVDAAKKTGRAVSTMIRPSASQQALSRERKMGKYVDRMKLEFTTRLKIDFKRNPEMEYLTERVLQLAWKMGISKGHMLKIFSDNTRRSVMLQAMKQAEEQARMARRAGQPIEPAFDKMVELMKHYKKNVSPMRR